MVILRTVLMLLGSNILMTFAWYGHLGSKTRNSPLWLIIPMAWGIAFFEYCLQVPANRLGYGVFTAFQLKIIQEVITMVVFIGFAIFYLRQQPTWNILIAMLLILAAVYFAFLPTGK